MQLFVLAALLCAVASRSVMLDKDLDEYWENFKRVFGKSYGAREETLRRLVWERRVSEIFHHNMRANMGMHSFHLGINKYSDMTTEERTRTMKGVKLVSRTASRSANASTWLAPMNLEIPDAVDWRNEGLVTQVKDQGQCGSCWAFSTTGSLEGQHKRKTGRLVSLSEQNLVDCSQSEGNGGCNGGWMDYAFDYVIKNNGIDTEESYPYEATVGQCHYSKSNRGATCSGYVDLPEGDEDALKKAVASVGPVSVAIAVVDNFYAYKDGVYDTPLCGKSIDDLAHAVLVVGYGTENGKDFWLVKNSWGTSWGSNGYVKMSRNKSNQCGIATKASYPLV